MNDLHLTNIPKRIANTYDEEWYEMFSSAHFCIENLRNLALTGNLRNCRFRSICWRIYLNNLGEKNGYWDQEVTKSRDNYNSLRDRYIINPREKNIIIDDPLSIHDDSQWNKYFRSQDVIKEIEQDVIRTFPGIEFFKNNSVRMSMINVLYCYSQMSHLKYRQGMHEILAPIIFVLHSDHIAFEHSCELSILSEPTKFIASVLLDSAFLEHDAYSLFMSLMKMIEPWYDSTYSNNSLWTKNKSVSVDPQPFARRKEPVLHSFIGRRLSNIHENILKRLDLDLYMHLEKLEISPQMFGLRWLKLLFGREFILQDLLFVWDVVFAVGNDFSLVDYIYVSMLLHIREFLLANDFTKCVTQLMSYPANIDVNHIVDRALHLFKPDQFDEPVDTLQNQPLNTSALLNNINRYNRREPHKTLRVKESIASKFSVLMNKRTVPGVLQYQQTVAGAAIVDCGPATPTRVSQERAAQTMAANSADQRQVMRLCAAMIDEAITAIDGRHADQALGTLKQVRDILSGNLSMTAEVGASDNDLSCLPNDPITGRESHDDSSPVTFAPGKTIELRNVSDQCP